MKKRMKQVAIVMACTLLLAQVPTPYLYAQDYTAVQATQADANGVDATIENVDEQVSATVTTEVTGEEISEQTTENTTDIQTQDNNTKANQEQDANIDPDVVESTPVESTDTNIMDSTSETNIEAQSSGIEPLTISPDANGFIIASGILKDYTGTEKNITIPAGVTTIGASAFNGSTVIENVIIPTGVTTIEESAFYGCSKLQSVSLPEGLTTIGNHAFRGCTVLNNVVLPSTVTKIGSYAFKHCDAITSISIPNGVTTIGEYTFYGDFNLTSITLSATLTQIGDNAFYDCNKLVSITLPETLQKIGDSAFYNCASMTGITIPRSVSIISNNAFEGCNNGKVYTLISGIPTNYDTYFTITCYNDSYAYTYATNKCITVVEIGDTAEPGDSEDEEDIILVDSIVLNATKVTLAKKASITLIATISPENAEDKSILWSSSDEKIATVSDDGVVTAKDAGTATITAYAEDGSDAIATCTITVPNTKSYKIKYNLNKGTNAPTNPTYFAVGTKVKLANPTRKNYIFTGWYLGEEKVTYISKTTTGNITLTAQWEKVKLDKTVVKSTKNNKAGQITINFEKLSGAGGYTVYYSTDKKLSNATTFDVSSKKKTATISGLVKGTTYYVTVKAYKLDSQENRVYGKSNQILKIKIKK